VAPARSAALALLLLAACGAPGRSLRGAPDLAFVELQARLGARAASLVGHTGGFEAHGERFNRDCTGFIQAVDALEGVPLRALMREAAPGERSGVAAAHRTMQRFGKVFGGGGAWPAPGDLVFWHDTYDRNRNGKADDRFTHVGVVEYVVDGTVVFLHRGSSGVARGVMTPARPNERAADGVVVNTPLRAANPRLRGTPALAGALFAGYGRIDAAKLPAREVAAAR
jgi:probable lipoprotein NlpC